VSDPLDEMLKQIKADRAEAINASMFDIERGAKKLKAMIDQLLEEQRIKRPPWELDSHWEGDTK
jgi:hypothetical protein